MIIQTIACLCIFSLISLSVPDALNACSQHEKFLGAAPDDIDSLDQVIFDLEKMVINGQFIEVPVYIYSDDQINTLDFSMIINVDNLEYDYIIDHTGEMQYAAYLNPNDLKLRFTSNSFSPYPVGDFKVISVRFKVLSPFVYATDFEMMVAYLNGERCSTVMEGTEVSVATQEIIANEIFLSPNPAHDVFHVKTTENGMLEMYDVHGRSVINSQAIEAHISNLVDVHMLPKGTYTVRIVTKDQKIKIQQISLL